MAVFPLTMSTRQHGFNPLLALAWAQIFRALAGAVLAKPLAVVGTARRARPAAKVVAHDILVLGIERVAF